MNVQWLENFLVLWETQNFTLSARKANISQAAFSRRILALENWLGHQLVDRSRNPIVFTEKGILFRQEAADLLDQFSQARNSLSDIALGDRNHVSVLMPHVISSGRFVEWWEEWSRDTNLTVSAKVGNVTEMIAAFIAGGADILICHSGGSLPMMLNPDLYKSHTIEVDQLAPFVSPGFDQQAATRFPGTQSNPIPLVLYTKGGYFAGLVDDVLANAPAQLYGSLKVEADTASLLKKFIANGAGVGWLPRCALANDEGEMLRQAAQQEWCLSLPITAYIKKDSTSVAANLVWGKLTKGAAGRSNLD